MIELRGGARTGTFAHETFGICHRSYEAEPREPCGLSGLFDVVLCLEVIEHLKTGSRSTIGTIVAC